MSDDFASSLSPLEHVMCGWAHFIGKHVKLTKLNKTRPKTYRETCKTYKTHTFLEKKTCTS